MPINMQRGRLTLLFLCLALGAEAQQVTIRPKSVGTYKTNQFTAVFQTTLNSFVVERSVDLKVWTPILTNTAAGDGQFKVVMDCLPPKKTAFYRLVGFFTARAELR